jgi:L-rhamnose mutarotase
MENISSTQRRFGSVIRLRAEKLNEYMALHQKVWPEVYDRLTASGIRNFTIFHREFPDGKHYLFMTYEYVGDDHARDMQAVADDPKTQEWWKLTDPCQEGLENRVPGEWWAAMNEVCHKD